MEEKEILKELYNIAVENLKPSAKYMKAQDKVVIAVDKLLKSIGDKYREEIDKLTCLQNAMYDVLDFEMFCAGFSMAMKLNKEIEYK